jgi:hypothetical protein
MFVRRRVEDEEVDEEGHDTFPVKALKPLHFQKQYQL